MFKLSDIISLPVINLYEVKIEGYIEKAFINPTRKQIEYVIVYNEKDNCYKAIKFTNIYKICSDAIFITNSSKITLYENVEFELDKLANPINSACYSIDGIRIGNVKEINFNGAKINNIIVNNTIYESSAIIGINNNLVILSPNHKVSIKRFRQTAKRIIPQTTLNAKTEPVVTILDSPQITPSRTITNYNFLLNRIILKDIKSPSGEIIANKNTLITSHTLNKLKYYGKLKEVMHNSK